MIKRYIFTPIIAFMILAFSHNSWAMYEMLNVAVNGYDVVAYHTQNKAVPGENKFHTVYNGAFYLFSSKKHKELFDASPEKYLPAYGGYCALAMAKGKKHLIDPRAFKIVNGKLYLNGNTGKIQHEWMEDMEGNIKKGDVNWDKSKEKDPNELEKVAVN